MLNRSSSWNFWVPQGLERDKTTVGPQVYLAGSGIPSNESGSKAPHRHPAKERNFNRPPGA